MAKWWYGGLQLSVEYDNNPADADLCCFSGSFVPVFKSKPLDITIFIKKYLAIYD